MFCDKCGNEIEVNAKFCSKCGSPTAYNNKYLNQRPTSEDQTVFNYEAHKNDSADTLISNLEIAIPIYQTLAEMNEKLEQLKRDKSYYFQVSNYINRRVLIIVFLDCAISVFCESLLKAPQISFVLSAILLFFFIKEIHKNWRNLKAKRETEIKATENQIKKYFITHECSALYCVPKKYQYYIATSYIYECLKNGRASNLKEAINLYEEQCYRWKMESSQQQINAKLNEHSRMLNRIETQQSILTFINLMK